MNDKAGKGLKVAKILLANYFLMSELPIPLLPDLQSSINFNREKTRLQGFQDVSQCSANSIFATFKPNLIDERSKII
jgi:hypothetical protein